MLRTPPSREGQTTATETQQTAMLHNKGVSQLLKGKLPVLETMVSLSAGSQLCTHLTARLYRKRQDTNVRLGWQISSTIFFGRDY